MIGNGFYLKKANNGSWMFVVGTASPGMDKNPDYCLWRLLDTHRYISFDAEVVNILVCTVWLAWHMFNEMTDTHKNDAHFWSSDANEYQRNVASLLQDIRQLHHDTDRRQQYHQYRVCEHAVVTALKRLLNQYRDISRGDARLVFNASVKESGKQSQIPSTASTREFETLFSQTEPGAEAEAELDSSHEGSSDDGFVMTDSNSNSAQFFDSKQYHQWSSSASDILQRFSSGDNPRATRTLHELCDSIENVMIEKSQVPLRARTVFHDILNLASAAFRSLTTQQHLAVNPKQGMTGSGMAFPILMDEGQYLNEQISRHHTITKAKFRKQGISMIATLTEKKHKHKSGWFLKHDTDSDDDDDHTREMNQYHATEDHKETNLFPRNNMLNEKQNLMESNDTDLTRGDGTRQKADADRYKDTLFDRAVDDSSTCSLTFSDSWGYGRPCTNSMTILSHLEDDVPAYFYLLDHGHLKIECPLYYVVHELLSSCAQDLLLLVRSVDGIQVI